MTPDTPLKILRCISWTAVSSEEQGRPGKISLSDQRQSNLNFIQSIPTRYPGYRGMIVAELEVQGSRRIIELSEAIATHDAYCQLYDAIKARTFDVLVCPRWDRLGREESLLITIRDLCIANNIAVAVTSSPPPTLEAKELHHDEGWRIAGTVQAWGSGREDREISRRVKTGRRNSVLNNKNFLKIPHGYRYIYDADGNRTIEIDDKAAALVRRILVDMYLAAGMGKPAIADKLNSEGIPTVEGSKWMSGTVDRYLRMRWVYAGYVEFGRHCDQPFARVKGNHPAIITEDEVRRMDAENRQRRPGPRRVYALSGVVWCGECDRPMAGSRKMVDAPDGDGEIAYLYLRCRECGGPSVREDYAYNELEWFVNHLLGIEDISEFVDGSEYAAAQVEINKRLAQIANLLDNHNNAIERLLDAYELGTLPQDRLTERVQQRQQAIKSLSAERDELTRQLSMLVASGSPLQRAEEIRAQGLDMIRKAQEYPDMVRRWLREHIRMVAVKGRITDIYLMP